MADGPGRIESLGADIGAIHDGVAAEQAVRVLEVIEAFAGRLVAGIGQEPPGLEQRGRSEKLLGISPE